MVASCGSVCPSCNKFVIVTVQPCLCDCESLFKPATVSSVCMCVCVCVYVCVCVCELGFLGEEGGKQPFVFLVATVKAASCPSKQQFVAWLTHIVLVNKPSLPACQEPLLYPNWLFSPRGGVKQQINGWLPPPGGKINSGTSSMATFVLISGFLTGQSMNLQLTDPLRQL